MRRYRNHRRKSNEMDPMEMELRSRPPYPGTTEEKLPNGHWARARTERRAFLYEYDRSFLIFIVPKLGDAFYGFLQEVY